ncbi:DUF3253 domain-containing protein [uncultured Jannaschia sp.]|uniref:DUF3253 domain-containing protein n=1 Tax=uncultured Jannaschia sp. TaxID=293347 RepID=UPI00262E1918|nr:DUF3253 domain-containing protein [uncultured Jannaschia sp.]
MNIDERRIAEEVLRLTRARAPKTICPSEVARALRPEGEAWRDLMPEVRRVAAALPGIVATQGGQPVDAAAARGPIRLSRDAAD